MNEIKCPHCGKAFKIDEAGYADILKQVRDVDFEEQLHARLELADREKRAAVELAITKVASEMREASAAKDHEIQDLWARIRAGETERKLAVTEAVTAVEKQRDALAMELQQAKEAADAAARLAQANLVHELQRAAAAKDAEIQALAAKVEASAVAQQLAITEAISSVERERDELRSSLQKAELEKQLAEKALKDKYETQIKDRDEAIERLRDMKARLSTKMVGETLEQHCETEFNRIRATAFEPVSNFVCEA